MKEILLIFIPGKGVREFIAEENEIGNDETGDFEGKSKQSIIVVLPRV